MKNPSEEQLEQWHKDPNNWKLGLFYYNPDDERLFPPKRMKWAGWTVNFANPKSIVAFVVLVIVLLLFVYRKQVF
ncbi:Probable transmembrane protein of unknown function [Flavobacterium indicum GPTSA100-9 = DSM 17447]|uniref:DUF5808 domain-containing protein n=1 Tax=Flavobacterium indicum (strain DSM 17447 / CIP 109464 / GPTSA100-9) TaxID=1094466 RepID=H8XT96_FLAIG|nr:DUF5808 domain-containing protein [Flavobacterium indicum]CCG52693.1 Probable transmembrane protein of unknown function [Flavobacterium indicum GPTSA100-9 = DSM 17447]